MFRNQIYSVLFLSAFSVWSHTAYAQAIEVFPSEVTKKKARESRNLFFNSAAAQEKFAKSMKKVAEQDKAKDEDMKLLPRVQSAMFDEFNTNAATWLQSYRGIKIDFASDMTPMEKAEYNSKLIGFLQDMKDAGVGQDERVGSKLDLNLHVYRSPAKYNELREKFGDDVLAGWGINAPQGDIYSGPRAYVIKRALPNNHNFINPPYSVIFEKQDNQDRIKMVRSNGAVEGYFNVEASADLEAAKKVQMDSFDITSGTGSVAAFHAPSDSLKVWEVNDEVVVISKPVRGTVSSATRYEDQWIRIPTDSKNKLKSLVKKGEYNSFESAKLVIANSPEQVPMIYYAADPVFRQRITEINDQKIVDDLNKILKENRIEAEKRSNQTKQELKSLLDSLNDPNCSGE